MLTFSLDSSGLDRRIDDMRERLKKLGAQDIQDEMFNWQAEDMHRKRPRVRGFRKRATTIIRPHSVAEMKREHRAMLRAKRRKGGFHHLSTRPILRPELYERLCQRMRALLATVSW